jgi:hypothetical protein
MVQVCSRCQRSNPDAAVFCWFDGVVLRQGAAAAASVMPQEFLFPSGRRCRTFDELVQGCQYEWEDAREQLRGGGLAGFLARIGRHDLSHAAAEAQKQPDADIALHQFLGQLPALQVQGPKLDLHPRRLAVGPVRADEQRLVLVTVTNQGKGLLQGKVAVTEGDPWLKVAPANAPGGTAAPAGSAFPIKTGKGQQVTLVIDPHGLAAPRTYSGKLTVVTNGGVAEVPIRLDVAAVPFARPPFQGVRSPREMAEQMRSNPRPAAPLLESGEVARWFAANGWTYPVSGATARGVAAVQQFFEGMGLSNPPPLQLSETEVRLVCAGREPAPGQVTLRTAAKKWVYAQVESDAPWLQVTTPAVSGPQQAPILFEADPSGLEPGRAHEATLQVVANAGQRLAVCVRVQVPRPRVPPSRRLLRPVLVGAALALLVRLLLAGPADVYARGLAAPPADGHKPVAAWLTGGGGEVAFLRPFVLSTAWVGALVAVVLVWRRGGRWTDLFCAVLAGGFAGLVGSATAGCALLLLDAPARAVLGHLAGSGPPSVSPRAWLPLWVVLACACWALAGAALACVLTALGRGGGQLLAALAAPLAGLLRVCGLNRAAAFFLLER